MRRGGQSYHDRTGLPHYRACVYCYRVVKYNIIIILLLYYSRSTKDYCNLRARDVR